MNALGEKADPLKKVLESVNEIIQLYLTFLINKVGPYCNFLPDLKNICNLRNRVPCTGCCLYRSCNGNLIRIGCYNLSYWYLGNNKDESNSV